MTHQPDQRRTEALLRFVVGMDGSTAANFATGNEIRFVETVLADIDVVVREQSPPESVIARALALASALPRPIPWLDRTRAVIASLVIDARMPALAGVRSGAGPRTLTFDSGGYKIDLEVDDIGDDGFEVHGQVHADGREINATAVALVSPESFMPTKQGVVDSRGYFTLSAHRGLYEIAISIGGGLVILPATQFS